MPPKNQSGPLLPLLEFPRLDDSKRKLPRLVAAPPPPEEAAFVDHLLELADVLLDLPRRDGWKKSA